jgi:UDP-glucose 4-epimerase
MARRFLVTGGAGFVGSHLVAALLEQGAEVVVLDDLTTGHRAAVLPGARLVAAGLEDAAGLDTVLAEGEWHAVFHFASLSLVGDSMRDPIGYLSANVGNGLRLIEACVRHKVERLVLSSTAALFGTPDRMAPPDFLIDEDTVIAPGSPYGESKWMLERALDWAARIHGLRSAALRYFNAAGADPAGRLGEDHRPETHLVPLAIDAMLGRRGALAVFGTDYDTPDGTCIRDYIHVSDLASAHLAALGRLDEGSVTYNLGTATGHSVLEVIRSVERVSGRRVPHSLAPRRGGDPARLVASPARIMRDTGWAPRHAALDDIVATALRWREAHPNGYGM